MLWTNRPVRFCAIALGAALLAAGAAAPAAADPTTSGGEKADAASVGTATGGTASAARDARTPLTALHTEGTRIVDEYGRTVLVHGVNNVDKGNDFDGRPQQREQVVSGDGHTVDADDSALLAGYGVNAVRLGVSFEGLMPREGEIDHAYIDRVVGVVDMLARHGIRTLLDNHQDGLSPVWGGNGFPAWAIDARPLPGEPNPGFPLYYLMPSMNLGWDEVWNNDHGVLDQLGAALGALAGAVRGHDGVMGIELLNEPWPGTSAPTCFPVGCPSFDGRYQSALESLTAAVRAQNPDIPVYWEPNVTWNQMMPSKLGAVRPITAENIVFAPHDYCAPSQSSIYLGLPSVDEALCPIQQGHTWANIDAVTARTGLPTVVTEFGDDDTSVLPNTLRNADERFAGWFYWHYTPLRGAGWTRPDPFAGPVRTDAPPPAQTGSAGSLGTVASVSATGGPDANSTPLSGMLVRTYPQATAGTPVSMDFDIGSGAFTYTYGPGARAQEPGPAGETVIYVSSLHYPDGYVAAVDGGVVTSAPGARYLTVRADGSGPVTVRVHGR